MEAITALSEKKKLLILLAIAFAIRLFLLFHTHCIAKDGITIIALARDFAAGNFEKVAFSPFPPGYPLLIALAHNFVGNWELAGQFVSLLLGTLTIIPLYLLGRRIFDQRVALLSCLFFAIHPYLGRFSAEVLRESTYIFFFVTAVWLSWEALSRKHLYLYPLIALAAALAYLTRTEGIGILIVVGLWVLLQNYSQFRQTYKRRLMALCLLFLTLPTLSSPYLLHLRKETGEWKLDARRAPLAVTGLTEFVRKTEEGRFIFDREAFTARLKRHGRTLSLLIIQEIPQAYHGLLLLLLLFGLIKRKVIPYRRKGELFLSSFIIFYILLIFPWFRSQPSHRMVTQLVPIALFWAGAGFYEVHQRICSRIGFRGGIEPSLAKKMFCALMIVTIMVILFKTLKPQRLDKLPRKEAGVWLKEHSHPHPLIMSTMPRVAFYAEGRHLKMPEGAYQEIISYAKLNAVDYLVVDEEKMERLSPGFIEAVGSKNLLELIYVTSQPDNRIIVYRVR